MEDILWALFRASSRCLGLMQVKKGDRVLFAKYAGSDVKLNDEECLILREDDILGIIS